MPTNAPCSASTRSGNPAPAVPGRVPRDGAERDVLARIVPRAPDVARWLADKLGCGVGDAPAKAPQISVCSRHLVAPSRDANRRRYYLAYARGASVAVLRLKDAAGLNAWRNRSWRLFASPVTITDVTLPTLELVERITALPFEEQECVVLWVELGPPIRFEAHPPSARPVSDSALALWLPAPGNDSDIPRHRSPYLHVLAGRPSHVRAAAQSIVTMPPNSGEVNFPCGHPVDGNTIVHRGMEVVWLCAECAGRPDCQRPSVARAMARGPSRA